LIVDLRRPRDFCGGRLPRAISLPGEMFFEVLHKFDQRGRIVFVCDDGSVSQAVATRASQLGYTRAAFLAGGQDAWDEAGLPIECVSDGLLPSHFD
jgi:rhodanese-related sulfurtransferase